ncbi:hypothetical protein ACFLZW_03105 [Chloroflexota bacterium]
MHKLRSHPLHHFTKLIHALLFISALLSIQSLNHGQAAAPLPEAHYLIERLCGKLVFIKDYKTNYQTIGLLPCGGGKPYIFHAGPKELHDYYQFANVKIGEGDVIRTLEWGKLSTYIVDFDSYIQLNHCGDCGKSFVPTNTPLPTITSQFTATITPTRQFPPTPTPWSPTQDPSLLASATPSTTYTTQAETPTPATTMTSSPRTDTPQTSPRPEKTITPTLKLIQQDSWWNNTRIIIVVSLALIFAMAGGGLLVYFLLRRQRDR